MSSFSYTAFIGPPRSGTTWLHGYLRAHPEIAAPVIKELNWFNTAMGLTHPDKSETFRLRHDRIVSRRAARGLTTNAAAEECLLRYRVTTDSEYYDFCTTAARGMPFVDVSPAYCMLPEHGFARMKSCFGDAKVVLLLRNPADWAWSYRHLLTRERTEQDAVDFANNFPDQIVPSPTEGIMNLRQIYANVAAVFSSTEILCLFTEDLFDPARQQSTLDELSQFLNVPPHTVGEFDFIKNRGQYSEMPTDFRADATRRAREDVAWARAHMGRLPRAWEADSAAYLSG